MHTVTYNGPSKKQPRQFSRILSTKEQRGCGVCKLAQCEGCRSQHGCGVMWELEGYSCRLGGHWAEYFEVLLILLVYSHSKLSAFKRRLRWQLCVEVFSCIPVGGEKKKHCWSSQNTRRSSSDGFASAATLDSSSGWRKLNIGCACVLETGSI